MKTDVVIVGGGPGGAASAMFLAREGIKPVIFEQETFPRYHINLVPPIILHSASSQIRRKPV